MNWTSTPPHRLLPYCSGGAVTAALAIPLQVAVGVLKRSQERVVRDLDRAKVGSSAMKLGEHSALLDVGGIVVRLHAWCAFDSPPSDDRCGLVKGLKRSDTITHAGS